MLSPEFDEVSANSEVVRDHGDTRQTALGSRGLPDDRKARRPTHAQIGLHGGSGTHLHDFSAAQSNRLEQPVNQAPTLEDNFGRQ